MPTILWVQGWRLFFYRNEGYELTPRLRREVRKIIFDHFELIVEEWQKAFGSKPDANN